MSAAAETIGKAAARIRAVTEAVQEPAPTPRVIGQVSAGSLVLTQYKSNDWTGLAPRGCEPEDFHLRADPFDLLPDQVARFDTLRLIDPGDRWMAEYLCVEALTGRKVFALVHKVDLPPREADTSARIPAGYEIVQGGAEDHEDWLVRRVADQVVLNRHMTMGSYERARRYLLDHPTVRGEVHQSVY